MAHKQCYCELICRLFRLDPLHNFIILPCRRDGAGQAETAGSADRRGRARRAGKVRGEALEPDEEMARARANYDINECVESLLEAVEVRSS